MVQRIGIGFAISIVGYTVWKLWQRIRSATAPTIPTFSHHFALLQKGYSIPPHSLVVDMGCGSGSTLRKFVRAYNVQAVGYEYALFPLLRGRFINILTRTKNIRLLHKDFSTCTKIQADIVYVFLIPAQMPTVQSRLGSVIDRTETTLITHVFPLPDVQPKHIITDAYGHKQFFIYEKIGGQ